MKILRTSWLSPKVVAKKSPIHNLGLYSIHTIGKDEVVMVLGGRTMTDKQVREKVKRGERYDGVTIDRDLNLSILPIDWQGIYGNHSCDSNLWMIDEVTIIARQEIKANEELTIDYALFTISPDWHLECNCGQDLCRKLITGSDWKIPELRKRYERHFTPYINRLIREKVS